MSRRRAALAVLSMILVAGPEPTPSEVSDAASPAPALRGAPLDPAISSVGRAGAAGFPDGSSAGSIPARGANGGAPLPVAALPSAQPMSVHTGTTRSGIWAYANASHGPSYLAIPEGRGWIVEVCGPLGCRERVSTDAGPELYLQRAGRIGDLSSVDFRALCGPLSAGLCSGSYTILGAADQSGEDGPRHPADDRMRQEDGGPTLPPTDAR